jgi:hypothetical protein
MPRRFALRIGPACVALEGPLDPATLRLDAAHHRFLDSTAVPTLTIAVRHETPPMPDGPPVFSAGTVARFYRLRRDAWTIRVGGGDDPASPVDRELRFGESAGALSLDVAHSPELRDSYPLEYPLEEFLFRHLLAHRQAVLLHACGVLWRGRGYLFVGSSGAGKSTTARLWRSAGATVLNDDRTVLDVSAGPPRVHPTPWFGEHPEVGSQTAPLAAIYLLRQGPEPGHVPLPPARAAALLFAKSFPPLWDPDGIQAVLATLDAALARIPCGWLTVPPDQRAVEWVQARA